MNNKFQMIAELSVSFTHQTNTTQTASIGGAGIFQCLLSMMKTCLKEPIIANLNN